MSSRRRSPRRPRDRGSRGHAAGARPARDAALPLHPLFLLGIAVTSSSASSSGSPRRSARPRLGFAIVPAACFGVLGYRDGVAHPPLGAAARRRGRRSRRRNARAASPSLLPAPCRSRPGSCGGPGRFWAFNDSPPPADGFPFGPVVERRPLGRRRALRRGADGRLGGPLLGILVARWIRHARRADPHRRRRDRVLHRDAGSLRSGHEASASISPWTYFGGPSGVKGDPERMLLYTGSPYWWVAYLACLCVLGVIGSCCTIASSRAARCSGSPQVSASLR